MKRNSLNKTVIGSVLCLLLILSACGGLGGGGGGSSEDNPELLRIIHAAPSFSSVDASIGSDPIVVNVPYGLPTDYINAPEGDEVKLRIRTEDEVLPSIDTTIEIESGKAYTYLVTEADGSIEGTLLTDDNQDPDPGLFRMRLINVGLTNTGLDLYITRPDTDLDDASPVAENVEFKAASSYLAIDSGEYRVRITRNGKTTAIYDSEAVEFGAGTVWTAVLFEEEGGGSNFLGTLLQDK